MEKIINYIKFPKHLAGLILSILLIMTTFSIYIPENIFKIVIYIPQLFLLFYAMHLFILYYKKEYRPRYAAKIVFLITILLIIYYIFIILYRIMFDGNPRQSLSTALIIFTSVVTFFLIDANIITKREVISDLIVIFTLINIIQTIMGFAIGSIRQSTVLLNIMVYTSAMLFMVPLFFYVIQNKEILKRKKYWSALSWINLFFILIYIPASGSRSGFIMLIFTFILAMIVNYKSKTRFLIKSSVLYITVFFTIYVLFSYNIMDIKSAIMRQIMTLNIAIEDQTEIPVEELTLEVNKVGWIETQKEEYEESVKIDITGSDSIRTYLWEESIRELKKSPFLGTGTFLFEVEYNSVKHLQGSHNIILESSLIFGIIGMIMFMSVLAMPVVFIIMFSIRSRSEKLIREMLNYLISIANIMAMSMVQPLLVMAFPLILLWLISGITYHRVTNYI